MTEDRPTTDGGETAAPLDVERAGDAPPDTPTGDGLDRLLSDLLDDPEAVDTAHLVRAGLAEGSGRRTGERLVGALEDKVTVVGSTLDAGFDPANPELDVLVETDHDPGAIAASLASVGPVEGVSVVDATDAVERQREDDEADAADANDVFNELKEEVGREGYGQVVDELEDVSFPGGPDPDEEVDLEEAAGVELDDDGGDGGLDGEDELTTKQLLGEEERDDTEIKAPDEKAIEEAIEDVDLEDPTGGGEGAADGASAASGDEPATADAGPAREAGAASDAGAAPEESASAPDPTTEGSGQSAPADVDAFVGALVEALESGAIDEDRQVALREALGIESTHSLDVRMEYLQKRVDNLAAYTDAWEAFLSEEGSGREFMESVRGDLDAIEARLDDLEAGTGGDLGAVEDRLASIEDRLAALAERHDEDVARLDTRVDSAESKLGERLDAVEDAVESLRGKTRSLLQWREHIDDVLGGE